MNLQSLFQQAAGLHQQGRLAEAEPLYARLLQLDPANVPGRHLLGVLRSQQGRNAEAIELIGGALKANPKDFGAWLNYAMVLQRERRFDEALAGFERALALKPDFAEAQFGRAVLLLEWRKDEAALKGFDAVLALRPGHADAHYNRGLLLGRAGRWAQAIEAYDRALALNPGLAAAQDNRGNALRELGRLDEALASYDRALALDPRLAGAHYNRGVALADLERYPEALASYDAALAARGQFPEAHFNRAVTLSQMKRFAEALAGYDAALALAPSDAQAHCNRGVLLWNLGRLDEALASFDRAVAARPGHAEAALNRAGLLYARRQYGEALAGYDTVLASAPDQPRAWNGRGSALRTLGRFDAALESFDRAIALDPGYAEAYSNRAILLWEDLKRFEAARADLARLLALDPDWPYARGELLHLNMQACVWDEHDRQAALVDAGVRAGKRVVRPFVYQAVSRSPADLKACSEIFAADLFPPATPVPRPGRTHDRLRIGYVSGEFRDQATAHLMAGLYETHDRSRFDIVAFDSGWHDDGPMRKRLDAAFGGFVDIARLSDRDAAQAVAARGIDILVNLNGYFGEVRMGVFAHRPAPVQVNYLGFPATLGAEYIDYILADATVIPEGEKQFYSEKTVWLPDSYQANDSKREIAADGPSRAAAGLPADAFVFCNFNQSYKLTPGMFAAWMRILSRLDGSVLWLWQSKDVATANLRRAAEAQGVAGARLVFAEALPPARHLARLRLADLFLDSLPYNAHTTASDALWAGLPLLTCRGTTFPGRVAASLLQAAGLPELIAESLPDYESRAVALARDPARLKGLRDRLAQNRLTSPLFDTARFTRNLEAAYTRMWDINRRGEAPYSF